MPTGGHPFEEINLCSADLHTFLTRIASSSASSASSADAPAREMSMKSVSVPLGSALIQSRSSLKAPDPPPPCAAAVDTAAVRIAQDADIGRTAQICRAFASCRLPSWAQT